MLLNDAPWPLCSTLQHFRAENHDLESGWDIASLLSCLPAGRDCVTFRSIFTLL